MSACFSVCLFACLPVCLSACSFVCLSFCLSLCPFVIVSRPYVASHSSGGYKTALPSSLQFDLLRLGSLCPLLASPCLSWCRLLPGLALVCFASLRFAAAAATAAPSSASCRTRSFGQVQWPMPIEMEMEMRMRMRMDMGIVYDSVGDTD